MNAYDRCRQLLDRLKHLYPEAELSFGYIGNVYHNEDDRCWYFWAGAYRNASPWTFGNSASFGGVVSKDLDRLADKAEAELEAWVQALRAILPQVRYLQRTRRLQRPRPTSPSTLRKIV